MARRELGELVPRESYVDFNFLMKMGGRGLRYRGASYNKRANVCVHRFVHGTYDDVITTGHIEAVSVPVYMKNGRMYNASVRPLPDDTLHVAFEQSRCRRGKLMYVFMGYMKPVSTRVSRPCLSNVAQTYQYHAMHHGSRVLSSICQYDQITTIWNVCMTPPPAYHVHLTGH